MAATNGSRLVINSNSEAEFPPDEKNRWLSIKEEDIFLQNALLRSIGLLPNPFLSEDQKDGKSSQLIPDYELEGFVSGDVKSLDELSRRILRICTKTPVDLHMFHNFEFSILRKMWKCKAWNSTKNSTSENAGIELGVGRTVSVVSDDSNKGRSQAPDSGLSSKLGLLLIVPLLKSQSSQDPSLAVLTTNLLFEMLSNLPPMSLSKDIDKPLEALESLIIDDWMAERSELFKVTGPTTAVALCCARGVLSSFLKSFELLLSCDHLEIKLPVRDILNKLASMSIRVGQPCALYASNHISTWSYDDQINAPEKKPATVSSRSSDGNFLDVHKVTVAFESGFLFVSGRTTKGLSKIGSGSEGTLQGYVYSVNPDIQCSNLAAVENLVLIRDKHLDAQIAFDNGVIFAETVRPDTLEKFGIVYIKLDEDLPPPYMTVGFTSDGRYFYLLRVQLRRTNLDAPAATSSSSKPVEPPPLQVYLDVFEVIESESQNVYYVKLKVPRIALNREINPVTLAETFDPQPPSGFIRIIHPNPAIVIQGPRTAEETFRHTTTLGVDLTNLLKSSIFCCGDFLTLLFGYEGIGTIPASPSPAQGVQVLLKHLSGFSPVMTKGKGVQLHIILADDRVNYSTEDLVDLPVCTSFILGAPGTQLGACYDHKNNTIWTSNGQYFDMWKNPGHRPKWCLDVQQLVYKNDDVHEDGNLGTSQVLNILMTHVGSIASHFIAGDSDCNIGFQPDCIDRVLSITKRYGIKFDNTQLSTIIVLLQALVSQIKSGGEGAEKLLSEIKTVLCYLMDTSPILKSTWSNYDDPVFTLYRELGNLYSMLFEYSTKDDIEQLFQEIDFIPEKNDRQEECLDLVREIVYQQLMLKFKERHHFSDKWILNQFRIEAIINASRESTLAILKKIGEKQDGYIMTLEMPVSVAETQFLSAMTNYFLKTWTLQDWSNSENVSIVIENLNDLLITIIQNCTIIVKAASDFISSDGAIYPESLLSLENTLKSSLVGTVLPQILLFFISDEAKSKNLMRRLKDEVLYLSVSLSYLAEKLNLLDPDFSTLNSRGEDWSSRFRKPPTWQGCRYIESDHPLKDNSKIKETVTIPNARRLYVKFDKRCYTHYDYDKFTIFAGSGNEVTHICSFGGSPNRAGNGVSMWPTDFVQVDGDTMVFSFEGRGGRDRNSSDATVWGFAFTVYPVYDNYQYSNYNTETPVPNDKEKLTTEDGPKETNFVNRITLCSLDALHSFVLTMFESSGISDSNQEKIPISFQSNHFLTSFDWLTLADSVGEPPIADTTKVISKDVLSRLLTIAKIRDLPKMRPSMTRLIKPGLLQRLFVTACLRSLFHDKSSAELATFDESLSGSIRPEIVQEIFIHVAVIVRKLVSLVEMQNRLTQEIQDIISKTTEYSDAFFNSTSFLESQIDVVNLTTLLDIPLTNDGQQIIRDIYLFVDACIIDNKKAELATADELVKETHLKCLCMIAANRRGDEYRKVSVGNLKMSKQVVDSISQFVASHLNYPNDCSTMTFFEAVKQNEQKSEQQLEGLRLLGKFLRAASHYSQLVLSSSLLLQKFSFSQVSLSFTRFDQEIRESFGQATKLIVNIAELNPLLHHYSVFLLCILPYTRADETSLVESGLLGLLDNLCALQISRPSPSKKPHHYSGSGSESLETIHIKSRAASLAWAALKVLAARCSAWGTPKYIGIAENIALPVQISKNVTNHLTRASSYVAMSCSAADQSDGILYGNRTNSLSLTESIQDVLLLLDSLRDTRLGQTILKQSPCICRLLSLLQDPRLSPRLTHTILTLLHTALPLAENLNLSDMASTPIPIVKRSLVPGHGPSVAQDTSPHNLVANLLLSKLADFLICANQHPTTNNAETKCKEYEFQPRMAVWIHKGSDQTRFSDLLHILYNPTQGNELHPLLQNISDAEAAFNHESKAKVLVDDGDIAQHKSIKLAQMGFLVSLEPLHALPPPSRLNELPTDTVPLGSQPSARTRQDTVDHIGKERNSELANFDPARTFLSGEVAESLAAEVIRLLHILLAAPAESAALSSMPLTLSEESLRETCHEAETANSTTNLPGSPPSSSKSNCRATTISAESIKWAASVEQALCGSLKVLPKLSSIGNPIGRPTPLDSYGYSARLSIASLAVLGSFTESIRADAEVWIGPDETMQNFKDNNLEDDVSWDFMPTAAKVVSVNKNTGSATVEISENVNIPAPSRILEVSLSRLTLRTSSYSNSKVLEILSWETRQDICRYLRTLFTPSSSVTSSHCVDHCPIKKQLPTLSQIFSTATSASLNGTGSSSEAKTLAHGMTVVRLVAEIRTRAAQVLSIWLQNREFVGMFLGHPTIVQAEGATNEQPIGVPECLGALNVLKRLALQSSPSHRLGSLQAQVTRLRLLYRDSTKPPKVVQSIPSSASSASNLHWDFRRQTPTVRNCLFRNNFTGVTFAGESSSGAGNPRGVLLFATKTVPSTGFYFEQLILNTGEATNESSLNFSFGLLPLGNETRRDGNSSGAWQYPIGGVMFHSTGRFVHYVGPSLLSWKSEKIEEYSAQIGDTIGMGWEPMPVQGGSSTQNDSINPIPTIRARHTVTPHPPATSQRVVRARLSNADANTRLALSAQVAPETGRSAPPVFVTPPSPSTSRKGYVFLTLNGQRLPNRMENVDAELWPCLHLQRTNVSVDTNFGAKPFMYAEGRKPPIALPETSANSVASQVNRFFASAQTNQPGPSGTATGTLRRISESLQDLGVHFGNLTFYPLLEDEESEESDELSEPEDVGSGSDTLSEDGSPMSSRTHMSEEELANEFVEAEMDPDPDPPEHHNEVVISSAVLRAEELLAITSGNARNTNGTTVRQNGQRGGNIGTNKSINPPKEPVPHEQDRTATSKAENKDYASACLLDYHLAPSTSFDIKVFSGPNRYFCPCTEKNDSDLDQYMNDDSDTVSPQQTGRRRSKISDLGHVEGEDIHNLLVRAWEARVFPTIRRRFRNEAERRDGLEQIRGALQLGMIEIARQTVEYLYEDNGIPRDLHFPTLEEIRLESARFTLERIHPGVTVSIRRNRDTENESILPKYGVPAMLRTFGLIGEVLDVDMVHELVLVETYVETEGILTRFWYPLKDLEKPTSVIKPQLNSTTVNMLKLHSNLVDLESMLCHTYCRQAFLQILDEVNTCRSHSSSNRHTSGIPDDLDSGLTSLFQDLDLDNLQIRSDDNLADIPNNGDLLTRNLDCGMASMEFLTDSGNPSYVFYRDSKRLTRDLKCAIRRAISQGEDYVNELTNQICTVLKETPNSFITDTVPLDKEGPVSVSLPGVAFTAVCFSGLQTEKNISSIRNIAQPCVHLYGFNGGDSKKYAVGCFPVQPLQTLHKETSIARAGNISSSVGNTGANKNTNFVPLPHVLVPTNKLFCSITSTALKENFLEVQGIPAQFPLALLYSQLLIDLAKDNKAISRSNILNLICILTNFLERITLLPVIKEWIFAIVSEAINLLKNDVALMHEFYLAHSSVIYGLFRELVVNARAEINGHGARGILVAPKSIKLTNAQTSLNTAAQAGPSRPNRITRPVTSNPAVAPNKIRSIIAAVCTLVHSDTLTKAVKSNDLIGRLQQFPVLSSYLQMLTELCMTLFYVVQLFATAESTPVSSTDPSPSQTPQRKTSSIIQAPLGTLTVSRNSTSSSPSISTNAKKDKFVRIGKQGSKVHFTTPAAAAANQRLLKQRGPLSSDLQTKMVDVLCEIKNDQPAWFSSAYLTCQILKSIVWRESVSPNLAVLSSFIVEATAILQTVTNHSRLIVICGAPNNIHEMPLETSLIRALNETGGIMGHEIWISENSVDVVVEIHSALKTEQAIAILKRNQTWYPIEDFILYPTVAVHSVNENLETGDTRGDLVLKTYLNQKLFDPPDQDKFSSKVEDIISHIFTSCFISNAGFFSETDILEAGTIFLEEKHLLNSVEGNFMGKFIAAAKPISSDCRDFLKIILRKFGHQKEKPAVDIEDALEPACAVQPRTSQTKFKPKLKDDKSLKKSKEASRENFSLTLEGFSQWCVQLGKDNVCALFRALFATGYDIRLDRTWISETSALITLMTSGDWTKEQDTALVLYIDRLAETLRVPPQFVHPHEIYLEESHYSNPAYAALQDVAIERLRARCAILQFLNLLVSKNVLPYVPLHIGRSKKFSTAALLHDSQHILFYHLKDEFLYKVLQFSSLRSDDVPAPEIFLDPLQEIDGSSADMGEHTMFSTALTQLHAIQSAFFCVTPSTGGDPPLPMVVKFIGEEVHGLIGSFRHFLSNAVEEVKSPVLRLLIKCPSSDADRNKDSLIIRPGPLTLGEEKLLSFFGQFIGLCIRADAPISCSLLSTTWRSLVASTSDSDQIDHLPEVDILTSSFLNQLQSVESPEEFNAVLEQTDHPSFTYMSMDRKALVLLCPGGDKLSLSWETREPFIELVRYLRKKEIESVNRTTAILGGLATLLPMPVVFNLFTPRHFESRVCGSPDINLPLLKAHTHYQVGISETDLHILFFWAALESMTPDELKDFIKFAANQERLPSTCPCQNQSTVGGANTNNMNMVHVPPFPMKIAPIDIPPGASQDYINKRTIRAETCLFLIRLPPYSSYQVTRQQLLFACNSRDDPLSG